MVKICFQRTYEELKPSSPSNTSIISTRFQRTYEELKPPFFKGHVCFLVKGFQRTYEELKRITSSASIPANSVFSVPMRNWNKTKDLILISYAGFQRTYEELKHADKFFKITGIRGFQRTYEELKHYIDSAAKAGVGVFSVPMRNWNRKPTLPLPPRSKVFSVPMRNWNGRSAGPMQHRKGFSAYLWGIETPLGYTYKTDSPAFSAYLWGIETSDSCGSFCGSDKVFSVPMRNWNSYVCLIFQPCIWFSAYLWGIETRRSRWWWNASNRFQRTYEELKLPAVSAFRLLFHSFQRTYEELKPSRAAILSTSTVVFSVPMRNWNRPNFTLFLAVAMFSAYLWGIETLASLWWNLLCHLCFQRTYEELKLP